MPTIVDIGGKTTTVIDFYKVPNAFTNWASQGGGRTLNVYSDHIESTSNGSSAGSGNLAAIYLPAVKKDGLFIVEVTYASGYAYENYKPTIGYVLSVPSDRTYPYESIQKKVSTYPADTYISMIPAGGIPVIYLGNASSINYGIIKFVEVSLNI